MSGGEEELYLHNPRAAAAVWFWLACHYWCGTERSLPLPFFNEIAFDGDWTDGPRNHDRDEERERERGVVASKLMERKKPLSCLVRE